MSNLRNHLISSYEANNLISNFSTARSNANQALSAFIPNKVLKKYLRLIKSESANKGIKCSGIRIFFAKYDGSVDPNRANPNSETLVIYPTYCKGNDASGFEIHKAFDPILSKNDNILEIDDTSNNARSTIASGTSSAIVLNRMQMSPPR